MVDALTSKLKWLMKTPRASQLRVAVKSIVTDSNGRILLLKRAQNDDSFAGMWETPGGRVAIGESPSVALKRELKEELGATAKIGEPVSVWDLVLKDGTHLIGITYLSRIEGGRKVRLSEEHEEFCWATATDMAKLHMTASLRRELSSYFKRKTTSAKRTTGELVSS